MTVDAQKSRLDEAAKLLVSVNAPADLVAEVRRLKKSVPLGPEREVPSEMVRMVDLCRLLARDAPRKGAVAMRILRDIENAEVYGRGRSYGGGGRSSAVWCERHEDDRCRCPDKVPLPERSDSVGDMVARGLHDPAEATRHRRNIEFLQRTVVQNVTDLMELWHEVAGYATGDIPVPDSVERPSRGGDCLACGRYVPGTDSDRLRAGLCAKDQKHWVRHRGEYPDRQAWMIARRKQLAESEPERTGSVAMVEVTLMATGETLRLTPEQVAVWRTLNVEQRREFAAALRGEK